MTYLNPFIIYLNDKNIINEIKGDHLTEVNNGVL